MGDQEGSKSSSGAGNSLEAPHKSKPSEPDQAPRKTSSDTPEPTNPANKLASKAPGTVGEVLEYYRWLKDQYKRHPRLTVGGVFLALVLGGLYYWKLDALTLALIKMGWRDPEILTIAQPLRIVADDPRWDFRPGTAVVDNEYGVPALVVKAKEAVFPVIGAPTQALGDFDSTFDLFIGEGQKSAAWIARTQPNHKDYYLFRLTFPQDGVPGRLQAWAYKNGQPRQPQADCDDAVYALEEYRRPFSPGNVLRVQCSFRGSIVEHTFRLLVDLTRDANPHPVAGFREEPRKPCVFSENPYRFGRFGFIAEDQSGVTYLKYFQVSTEKQ
jgi:hypothetical protein